MSVAVTQLKQAKIALFANGAYVDTATGQEYQNLKSNLKADGYSVKSFTDKSAQGFASALDGRQVLVMPEMEILGLGLTNALIKVIRDFVGHGGTLVINGDEGSNDTDFLNAVFGFSLTAGGSVFSLEPLDKQAATAGTTFDDDAATILANNNTATLNSASLPTNALDLYQIGSGVAVADIPFGAGQIVYLGWDWYDAAPNGSQNNGWLKVLKSAVSETDHKIVGTDGPDTLSPFDTIPGQAFASDYNDTIIGRGGFDLVDGGGGDDVIKGGAGPDILHGGAGKDELHGGNGGDWLVDLAGGAEFWGGKGHDTFAFSLPGVAGVNRIEDFKHGEDIIELDHNEFGALDPGPLAASAFHHGSHATTADHRIIYNDKGVLLYDPDGTGPLVQVAFAKLPGHPGLVHGDFDVENFG